MENIIEVSNLNKTFKNEQALQSVNFTVKQGEIFGFLGPSGSGKTTTIKILTGQLNPTSGRAAVFNEDIRQLKKPNNRKRFGVLTDNSGLYARLSIEDNLKLYSELYDCSLKRINEVLEIVQLHEDKKKRVSDLSKGMRQRVTLARAILHEPTLLFLDEPTSALDPVTREHIHRGLKLLNEKGTTIFLTTHDMEEADLLCDRIAFLHKGEIKELDTPKSLKQKFAENKMTIQLKNGQTVVIENEKKAAKRLYDYMEKEEIVTIHSNEPTIGDIFMNVTGREL